MIRKALYVLAVVLVLIQFYRPDSNHSSYESAVNEFIQQNNVTSEVESVLKHLVLIVILIIPVILFMLK